MWRFRSDFERFSYKYYTAYSLSGKYVSIRVACEAFRLSQTCYRYVAKTGAENEEIADWLLRLTDNHRNWGFGLCFL